jgi:hypothetical protein
MHAESERKGWWVFPEMEFDIHKWVAGWSRVGDKVLLFFNVESDAWSKWLLSLSLSLFFGKKFQKMLSLEAKVIMGSGMMAQCEKVRERERENTSVKRESKRWLVIVACFLNNTLRACLRWSLIPPRMGLIPLSWGLIPISPRMGLIPLTLHLIPPCMGPIPPHMGLITLTSGPYSTLHGPDCTRIRA